MYEHSCVVTDVIRRVGGGNVFSLSVCLGRLPLSDHCDFMSSESLVGVNLHLYREKKSLEALL